MNDYESDAREATWAASCGFRSAAEYHAASREAFEEEMWVLDAWVYGPDLPDPDDLEGRARYGG